ncbi:hypothetical protein FisN_1Lh612 [Fistulifera solaris]|uniref:tRNA/rRNA methyltransferase SpoU type domain-containing protein n=1 Tax=Fistulifera solaris TaxID=1519565 RepID=A0A1Z5K180_FISSO|nr:hypothetical protein FisN_1Lh612 [Fistulifera solaris]|eukprot:GAX19919.1 hypothetical protein FisN_1Lh612 [Fistulifera solaris]
MYLLIENPHKGNNLGSIIRCACAFGIQIVVAVGYEQYSAEGSHGASKNVDVIAFPTSQQAAEYITTELCCSEIIGLLGSVENGYNTLHLGIDEKSNNLRAQKHATTEDLNLLTSESCPVHELKANPNCCLAVHRKFGLPLDLAQHCSQFVHIPVLSGILDSPACMSIVLHEFTEQFEYTEQGFRGQKFAVVRPNVETMKAKRSQERLNKKLLRHKECDEIDHYGEVFEYIGDY